MVRLLSHGHRIRAYPFYKFLSHASHPDHFEVNGISPTYKTILRLEPRLDLRPRKSGGKSCAWYKIWAKSLLCRRSGKSFYLSDFSLLLQVQFFGGSLVPLAGSGSFLETYQCRKRTSPSIFQSWPASWSAFCWRYCSGYFASKETALSQVCANCYRSPSNEARTFGIVINLLWVFRCNLFGYILEDIFISFW